MKKILNFKLGLTLLFGITFFALIFPYNHVNDIYIGELHTAICVMLNALSTILFSIIFYQVLNKRLEKEDFGMYIGGLVALGFFHGLFAIMNWGSWVCLGISVVIIIWMVVVWVKTKS